jgi:hypothetical protein
MHPAIATRRLLASSACAVLLAASACRESTAPDSSAGTYVLREIEQATLPVTYYSAADGTYSVVADTIELDGTGGAYRTFLVQVTRSTYEPDAIYGGRYPMGYRLDGTRIEIGYFQPCPPNALCAANDTGHLIGGVLVLESTRTGQRRNWAYERITTPR